MLPENVLRDAPWPVVAIWKRAEANKEQWEKWAIAMESAALRKVHIKEAGLYAWGKMEKDSIIGTYSGEVIKKWRGEITDDEKDTLNEELLKKKMTMALEITSSNGYTRIIYGKSMGPPFLQNANDARGLKTATGSYMQNNAKMMEEGALEMTKTMGGEDKWEKTGGWDTLGKNEILWSYGKGYWDAWGSPEMVQKWRETRTLERAVTQARMIEREKRAEEARIHDQRQGKAQAM